VPETRSEPEPPVTQHTQPFEAEQSRSDPPIRIEPIADRQGSDESAQATDQGERRESAQTDYGFDRFYNAPD
jgi:hypothetical protein